MSYQLKDIYWFVDIFRNQILESDISLFCLQIFSPILAFSPYLVLILEIMRANFLQRKATEAEPRFGCNKQFLPTCYDDLIYHDPSTNMTQIYEHFWHL